jgi:membrane protein implicated in regulation of membrane protease activity
MPEWLPHASQFTVFLGIAVVGFLILLISLVFGEMFDSDTDHDLSHGGPGFLSTRIISVFVTAFGGFGAVGTYSGLSILPSSGVGFVSGVFFAALIYAFATFLYSQQASTDVRGADLVGLSARVVVGIPAGGVGQVRCQVGEELVDKIARSNDGTAIAENTAVTIEQILGDTVLVRR